jgi:hypothetical protein
MSYKAMMPGDISPTINSAPKGGSGLLLGLFAFAAGAVMMYFVMSARLGEVMKRMVHTL